MTNQFHDMNRAELRVAAKAAGIKYRNLSVMQMRDALIAKVPVKAEKKLGVTVKLKSERKERTGTKMEAAMAVMEKNPNLVRKQIIAKFIDDVGLTKAGANTYYSLVQKKLKK